MCSVNEKKCLQLSILQVLKRLQQELSQRFLEISGRVLSVSLGVNGLKVSGSIWQRDSSNAGSSQLAEERHSWVMCHFCQQQESIALGVCFLTVPN